MRLIDADELKLKIVEEGQQSKRYKVGDFWELNRDEIWRAIDDLPTIERKTGKWIIQDNPETGWYRVVCSECGEDVTSNIPMIGFFPHCEPLWDYCPYCGADMRGEGHE